MVVPVIFSTPAALQFGHELIKPEFGIDLGAFWPLKSATSGPFGKTWLDIGPGIGSANDKVGLRPDFGILKNNDSNNKATFLIGGLTYNSTPLKDNKNFFAGVSADAVYGQIKINSLNSSFYGLRAGGSVNVGYITSKKSSVQLKYRLLPNYAGYDFKGVSIKFEWRF